MAHHRQAKKRNRQRIKRTERNRILVGAMRTCIKQVRATVAKGDQAAAQEALKKALSKIDSAAQKGVVHHKTAGRIKSRLTKAVNKLSK